VEYGDWNTITPKFIAFSGPSGTKTEIFPGLYSMVPSDYFDIWRRKGVGAVVRLNKKNYQVTCKKPVYGRGNGVGKHIYGTWLVSDAKKKTKNVYQFPKPYTPGVGLYEGRLQAP
jgi:hypothetical protein